MADKIATNRVTQLKFTLADPANPADVVTRSIQMDNSYYGDGTELEFKQRAVSARALFVNGGLSQVVQPTSWRDADDVMEPYQTVDVEISYIETTKLVFDLDS